MSETPVVGLLEYDEMVEEPVSSTISRRTWYHYALIVAALLFTAISLGLLTA